VRVRGGQAAAPFGAALRLDQYRARGRVVAVGRRNRAALSRPRGTEREARSMSRRRWAAACLLTTLTLVGSGTALAAEPKRPLPDYDGRGGTPQTPAQKALWLPRILLSPAYFVSEFLLRRPLGVAVTAAERAKVPK